MKPSELRTAMGDFCELFFASITDHLLIKEQDFSACGSLFTTLMHETQQEFSGDFEDIISEVAARTQLDVEYMLETDPASSSLQEIIFAYPGIYALTLQRCAHMLYTAGIKTLPRMISEFAHSKTGIDIHPGAKVGHHVAIDHGTGIVIGETAVIGNFVRLYHNVSLGNLSVKKNQEGEKRHPTIQDHVTIYAGAIILGGDTTIGAHSTIGGGAVVTSSVGAHSLVTTQYTTSYYSKHDKEEYANIQVTER